MKLTTTEISHLNVASWTRLPLTCETAQYHQTICTVKSHSRALATIGVGANFLGFEGFCQNFLKLAQKVVVRLLPTNFLP